MEGLTKPTKRLATGSCGFSKYCTFGAVFHLLLPEIFTLTLLKNMPKTHKFSKSVISISCSYLSNSVTNYVDHDQLAS